MALLVVALATSTVVHRGPETIAHVRMGALMWLAADVGEFVATSDRGGDPPPRVSLRGADAGRDLPAQDFPDGWLRERDAAPPAWVSVTGFTYSPTTSGAPGVFTLCLEDDAGAWAVWHSGPAGILAAGTAPGHADYLHHDVRGETGWYGRLCAASNRSW